MKQNHNILKAVSVMADRLAEPERVLTAVELCANNWSAAKKLMEQNRIVPQVGRNLIRNGFEDRLSPDVRKAFDKTRVETAAYNMLLMDTAKKIMSEAAGEGLEVLPLKGVSLLDRIYSADERGLSDMDFLVHENGVSQLGSLLRDMGFERPEGDLSESFEDVFSGEWKFIMERGGSTVIAELHWNINPGSALEKLYPLDASRLWDAVVRDGNYLCLSPEVEITYLLHHLSVRHSFCRLMWLLDIRYLLKNKARPVDMELLKEEIRKTGLERAAWLLVWIMREVMGDEAQEMITDWKPSRIERTAMTAFVMNALSGGVMKTSGLLPGLISEDPAKYYFHWLFPGQEFLKVRYPEVPAAFRQLLRAGDIAAKVFRIRK